MGNTPHTDNAAYSHFEDGWDWREIAEAVQTVEDGRADRVAGEDFTVRGIEGERIEIELRYAP